MKSLKFNFAIAKRIISIIIKLTQKNLKRIEKITMHDLNHYAERCKIIRNMRNLHYPNQDKTKSHTSSSDYNQKNIKKSKMINSFIKNEKEQIKLAAKRFRDRQKSLKMSKQLL
jgi:transcription initiation factor IIF auxiliary subunit